MENDSLNVNDSTVVESVLTDSSAHLGDVPEVQMPTPEQLGISIATGAVASNGGSNGAVPTLKVTVGDTFDFPVTVSWSVNGSALLVVPTSTATAKGLEQIGVSQESARMVKDGKEMASITFTYKIAAQDTGDLNIPVMRFEIPTPMGRPLDLRSESVPVRVDAPVNALPFAAGFAVAVAVIAAALVRMRRRACARAREAAGRAFEGALREQMMTLKLRVSAADSRAWLLELEGVCKEYAAEKFGVAADGVNLEELEKAGKLPGWKDLLEEFAQARYSAAHRDGYRNKETWKMAMKLMGVEEE